MVKNFSNNKDPYEFSFMYCFFNLKSSYVFSSQKVCTRSLYKLVDENKAQRVYDVNVGLQLCALVRNPYTRIESLYRDKCYAAVDRQFTQHCQKEIIKVFGEELFYNRSIQFEEFIIHGLDKLINSESHFFSQSRFIPEFIDEIYYIEKQSDLKYVFSLFDSDILHEHKTDNPKLVWTSKMKSVIAELYYEDFQRFRYSTDYT